MEYRVGDTVLLQLGTEFENAPRGLQRWDGCQFEVGKVTYVNHGWLYELKACKSTMGIPYTIMEEWLTPMR